MYWNFDDLSAFLSLYILKTHQVFFKTKCAKKISKFHYESDDYYSFLLFVPICFFIHVVTLNHSKNYYHYLWFYLIFMWTLHFQVCFHPLYPEFFGYLCFLCFSEIIGKRMDLSFSISYLECSNLFEHHHIIQEF